jgi:rfaE bifunctional protein nucleotidyltransferase chain/domain
LQQNSGLNILEKNDSLIMRNSKILELERLNQELKIYRDSGKVIGLCHGVFDLVHPGHLKHFIAAKKEVDILIVSVTADKFVNKGPGRPVFSESQRAEFIASLEMIDFVTISNNLSATEIIDIIKPKIYFKGSDYEDLSKDATGKIIEEKMSVENNGGYIHFTHEFSSSSSFLINKFLTSFDSKTKEWIEEFKNKNGLEESLLWIDNISNLKVLVLGEIIVDRYTYVSPLSKSSKDPILAFQVLNSSFYPGGTLAIANNCASWASKVRLVSFANLQDSYFTNASKMINSGIFTDILDTRDRPSILKHRYVDALSQTRVFEYYDFDINPLNSNDYDTLKNKIENNFDDFDVAIIADYGHGFFGKQIVDSLNSQKVFLAINAQANAGNRGFNSISKYKSANLLSFNGQELQIEFRNKNPDYNKIVPDLMSQKNASYAILTLGAGGLIVFGENSSVEYVPALASKVVDKVGAGDSVLSISSMLACIGAPLKIIGFIASIVAAAEISRIGHESPLSTIELKKHIKAILS